MPWYAYESQIAIDESGSIARNAEGFVYSTADTSFTTPLEVTDLAGVVRSEIVANALGLIEQFRVEDYKTVVWKSGDFMMVLHSIEGAIEEVEQAKDAAVAAQVAAEAAAAAASTAALPPGGTPGYFVMAGPSGTPTWAPAPTGGAGITGAPSTWPTSFPPDAHTTAVADLRTGVGQPLSSAAAAVLAALTAADIRAAAQAAPSTTVSFPGFGSTSTQAMRGDKTFKSAEIALTSTVTGLTAGDVQAALVELAARPTGGSGTTLSGTWVELKYDTISGSWPLRPSSSTSVVYVWTGPRSVGQPPLGGGYVLVGTDKYLAVEG